MKKRSNWDIQRIDLSTKNPDDDSKKGFFFWLKKNWKKILVIIVAVYLGVLAFGFATTRFYKDENGKTVAYRMSFSDLKKEDDYDELKSKLTDVRGLLRDITIVDIHLANGEYTNYEAATLYTKILNEQLDVMIPQVKALELQDEQDSIQKELESILTYDLALYLQTISKGLQSNSAQVVQTALAYRDSSFKTYSIIEADIKELGESIKIFDSSYFSWELNKAVLDKDGTAILKGSEDNKNGN